MVLNTLNSSLKRRAMILAVFSASQAAMNCITSSSVDHCFCIAEVRVRLPFQGWIFLAFLAAAWVTLKTAEIIYTFVSIRSSNTWISRINIMCRNQSSHYCFSWWQTQGWSHVLAAQETGWDKRMERSREENSASWLPFHSLHILPVLVMLMLLDFINMTHPLLFISFHMRLYERRSRRFILRAGPITWEKHRLDALRTFKWLITA